MIINEIGYICQKTEGNREERKSASILSKRDYFYFSTLLFCLPIHMLPFILSKGSPFHRKGCDRWKRKEPKFFKEQLGIFFFVVVVIAVVVSSQENTIHPAFRFGLHLLNRRERTSASSYFLQPIT
jgi:hypothetical protein